MSDGLRSFLDTTGQACGGDPEGLVPPPHLFPPTILDTPTSNNNLNATLAAVSQLLVPSEDSNYTEPCREVSWWDFSTYLSLDVNLSRIVDTYVEKR